MTLKKPLILVTNDDGIFSKGIRTLIDAVSPFGELLIIAPDKPQSGMGHAITVNNILRVHPYHSFEGHKAFTCTGTPVDCVKMAMYELKGKKPDLVVSGINHGENTSTNVLYSGTMSAAVEGAIEGIPSVGFSLADFDANADFEGAAKIVKQVVESVLKNKMPADTCLNVNIPKIAASEIKGVKICRSARAFWKDSLDKRKDQHGGNYYWLAGSFENQDKGEDTDLWAMENGFASIVPIHFDMTAYHAMAEINNWDI
jgi:5'-nucleotidase